MDGKLVELEDRGDHYYSFCPYCGRDHVFDKDMQVYERTKCRHYRGIRVENDGEYIIFVEGGVT